VVEFVALAAVATSQWFRHRIRGAGWAALAFGTLGVVSVVSYAATHLDPHLLVNPWFDKILIAAIFLLPYLLFRFAASFGTTWRLTRFLAVALTVGVLTITTLMRYFPVPGQPDPPDYWVFRLAFACQWGYLFSYVVIRLWLGGKGKRTVATKRMRLLAVAVAGLDIQVIVGALGLRSAALTLGTQAVTVVMGVLFLLALVLPSFLRIWWRKRDDQVFRRAVTNLVTAGTSAEVALGLLPHVCAIVGASSAALVDDSGADVARFPAEPAAADFEGTSHIDIDDHDSADVISVRTQFGSAHQLVVKISPYMPYFGREELEKLDELADVVGLAMERCELTERMAYQANHDSLTGLPNRDLFLSRLAEALGYIGRRSDALAIMFIDVDRFKLVNDRINHAAGDSVLMEVGRRLSGAVRSLDTVARVGGDEFVAFAEIHDEGEAVEVAERIREALGAPISLPERELSVTASVGVVLTLDRDDDPITLVGDADKAMYLAKAAGRDRVQLFTGHVRAHAATQRDLEQELDIAIAEGQLVLVYQPIFRLSDGCAVGVEALVRWEHPKHGTIMPDSFIPMAEDTGLIVPLGTWVLNKACRQAVAWLQAAPGLEPFTMWVNKSAGQFHRTDVLRSVTDTLAATGLASCHLGIEITENAFMSDTERLLTTMGALRSMGVSIAIDDFGTGYSSLGYLQRFCVDIMKIDRTFIQGIGHEPGTSLVTACLAMARSLDIGTVAEGVESLEHGAWLAESGCDHVQGFAYSRPVEPDKALEILISSRQGLPSPEPLAPAPHSEPERTKPARHASRRDLTQLRSRPGKGH
jgi:diguanylate cyclase (GGDEF)-like protein